MGGENNKVPLISSMSIFLVNEFVKGEKQQQQKEQYICLYFLQLFYPVSKDF